MDQRNKRYGTIGDALDDRRDTVDMKVQRSLRPRSTRSTFGACLVVAFTIAIWLSPRDALAQQPCTTTVNCAQVAVTSAAEAHAANAALAAHLAATQEQLEKLKQDYDSLVAQLRRGEQSAPFNVNVNGNNGLAIPSACPDGTFLASLTIKTRSGGGYAANSIVELEGDCKPILPRPSTAAKP